MSLDETPRQAVKLALPNQSWRADMDHGYVYILMNDRLNVLYIGCTADLEKRLYHHKHRLVPGFSKKYNVHRLVYFEELPDMDVARRRERQIKGLTRVKKEALIDATNRDRRDLLEELKSR